MEIRRLNEVFPEWTTRGVFSYLNAFDVPWKNSATPEELDIAYHGGRSGGKIISPLVDNMLTDGQLNSDTATVIAKSILAVNGRNWSKLWDTLNLDYNPIENYRMVETEQETGSSTNSDTSTVLGSSNNTGEGQASTSGNNATNVFGFNSDTAVGADTGKTDTETNSTQSATVTTNETREVENAGTSKSDRTLTRSGNIGVTTSQQMIESERSLWDWYFFDVVFRDLDKILTLTIY